MGWGVFEVSEMKPVAYTSQIDLDRVRKGKAGDMYGSPQWEGSDEAVFTVPLYTADQLAEAVAVEREKNAKLSDEVANQCVGLVKNIVRSVSQAIRSAAK